MTTDRELTLHAARAIGWTRTDNGRERVSVGKFYPLLDDGDAFRLVVNCGLSVQVCYDASQPLPWLRVSDRDGNWTHCGPKDYSSDKAAWTRRTVVEAAAKIGRAMP